MGGSGQVGHTQGSRLEVKTLRKHHCNGVWICAPESTVEGNRAKMAG